MASYNKFNQFSQDVAHKVHNLGSDTIKVMLSNTLPLASNAVKADITEIAAGSGYTAGGLAATLVSSAQTSGLYKLTLADITFTADGGPIGPFRYAVVYNDTPSSPLKPLIGWWDYGASVTLNDGDLFIVDMDQVNGVITLQ